MDTGLDYKPVQDMLDHQPSTSFNLLSLNSRRTLVNRSKFGDTLHLQTRCFNSIFSETIPKTCKGWHG